MIDNYEQTIHELNMKAFSSYEANDLENAKDYFEKICDYDPYSKDAYYNLAKVYYELNNYEKSINVLLELVKIGDDDDSTFLLLGDSYTRIEKYSEALLCYKRLKDNDLVNKKVQEIKGLFKTKEDKLYMQYMSYPYPNIWYERGIPQINLEATKVSGPERRQLFYTTQYIDINYIQLKYWENYKDLKSIRVLNAGCGTGEGLVQLASVYPEVEFVAIDMSDNSLEIAKGHAQKLKATNIKFYKQDITKICPEDYGYFDIIISTGVLHHLYSPIEGIKRLKTVLKEDGILAGMVYATIGRREVYDFRDIFSDLFTEAEQMESKIRIARALITSLQPWQSINRIKLAPDVNCGDQGLVDLLLNANETSYTISELKELFNSVDLNIDFHSNNYLNPSFLFYNILDHETRNRLLLIDKYAKAQIAEILNGSIFKHHFITYKKEYIPCNRSILDENIFDFYPVIWQGVRLVKDNFRYYIDLKYRSEVTDTNSRYVMTNDGELNYFKYPLTEKQYRFLKKCKGKYTIKEILNSTNADFEVKELKKMLFDLYSGDVIFFKKNKVEYYNEVL